MKDMLQGLWHSIGVFTLIAVDGNVDVPMYKGINSDKCNNKCNGINAHYSEALRIKANIMAHLRGVD